MPLTSRALPEGSFTKNQLLARRSLKQTGRLHGKRYVRLYETRQQPVVDWWLHNHTVVTQWILVFANID